MKVLEPALTDPQMTERQTEIGNERTPHSVQLSEKDLVSERINQSWNVIAAYTALHAFVTKDTRGPYLDDELPGAPRHSGSLYTYYSFDRGPLRGFSLGAGAFGTGRRYTTLPNPAFQLPGHIRTDLTFGYQRERWRVDVAIKNLNNSRYFELGDSMHMMPQAPRHALVGLKYRF
jgi:iron complex outermembrane receptor protein